MMMRTSLGFIDELKVCEKVEKSEILIIDFIVVLFFFLLC